MLFRSQGQSVTIAPEAGITANDVGYGVVLNGVAPPNGEHLSIDEITRELVKDMEQNEAMKPEGNPRPITVAGIEGRSLILHSVSPFAGANGQPQRERDWLVTIPQRDGSVIFMIFVAPHSDFDRFE